MVKWWRKETGPGGSKAGRNPRAVCVAYKHVCQDAPRQWKAGSRVEWGQGGDVFRPSGMKRVPPRSNPVWGLGGGFGFSPHLETAAVAGEHGQHGLEADDHESIDVRQD